MQNVDRILVGLELREEDLFLIKQTKELVDIIKPSKVDFIHIEKTLDTPLPNEIRHFQPRDEKIEQMMRDEVSLYFEGNECAVDFEVIEGKPVEQLLRWATIKQCDLLVLGRKSVKKVAEITLEKLVRKAPCSVMVIPEGSSLGLSSFLFTVDYSEKTAEGIKFLNRVFKFPIIEGLNFFELPSGYYKTGKSEEEFTLIMDNNCKVKAEKLLKDFPDNENLTFRNVCSEGIDEFEYILDYAKANNHNVIAVGSRGRTTSSAILIGSFAEKLLRHNRKFSTLIIKKKGENMDFLKAFLNL